MVALTEKANLDSMTLSKCLTTVVLPDPEGAEKMMSFSNVLREDFQNVKVGNLERNHQMAVGSQGKLAKTNNKKNAMAKITLNLESTGTKKNNFLGGRGYFCVLQDVAKLF